MKKRIIAIADTHANHEEVSLPAGDILVVAGDFSGYGTREDVINFNAWLGTLDYAHKVVVAGNHDLYCEGNAEGIKLRFTNAVYLDQEAAVVGGIKFYGCPYTPRFGRWAFAYDRFSRQSADILNRIPEDTEVLVTHGPAAGLGLSMAPRYNRPPEETGCLELREKITNLPKLKYHVCGHIHGGFGKAKLGDVMCLNVSVMSESYDVVNAGTVFNL